MTRRDKHDTEMGLINSFQSRPTQLNKMDCVVAFSEITFYWLLQKMRRVAMATDVFLPASLNLILEVILMS